jgi:hypothetical protein
MVPVYVYPLAGKGLLSSASSCGACLLGPAQKNRRRPNAVCASLRLRCSMSSSSRQPSEGRCKRDAE